MLTGIVAVAIYAGSSDAANDHFAGFNSRDTMFGFSGADWMDGESGSDGLFGGEDPDASLLGGSGAADLVFAMSGISQAGQVSAGDFVWLS